MHVFSFHGRWLLKEDGNEATAVVFANGERGIFDCRPYLSMGYYKPLNDPALFKRVGVSYGWLNWPGDIDIGADDVWADAVRS